VSFTGEQVRRGEPILSLYSPELVASQEELVRAREAAARFATSSLPEVRRGGEELVAAARRRLELFDVPSTLVEEVERSGQVQRTVTLLAPASGVVTGKQVFEGHRVEPGMELFTLTDLSRVWVEAEFYEGEASGLRLGQEARLELPYDPGVTLEGRIAFVEPTLDPVARTLGVRFECGNPDLRLKPGMFVDVATTLGGGEGLLIPDSALLDTGARQVVFVERGGGVFEPRDVKGGARSGGMIQVISGLEEGERVVTGANFLLDSESRLRAALAGSGHQHGGGS
jgi:RND family efflux transporter MFP subunit